MSAFDSGLNAMDRTKIHARMRGRICVRLRGNRPWGKRQRCSNRPSRISTTCCGKRRAAPRSWTMPSRRHGCCFSNTWTTWSTNAPWRPSWRARPTRTSSTSRIAGRAGPRRRRPTARFDHDKALTGDDLIDYVNRDLFPYLQGFKTRATGPDTIEYKIGEIFGEIKNKFQSGYAARRAGADGRAALPLAEGEARAFASLRSQDQEHGQRRAATAANTTRRARSSAP